jgi:hypothetical protein
MCALGWSLLRHVRSPDFYSLFQASVLSKRHRLEYGEHESQLYCPCIRRCAPCSFFFHRVRIYSSHNVLAPKSDTVPVAALCAFAPSTPVVWFTFWPLRLRAVEQVAGADPMPTTTVELNLLVAQSIRGCVCWCVMFFGVLPDVCRRTHHPMHTSPCTNMRPASHPNMYSRTRIDLCDFVSTAPVFLIGL